MTAFMIEHAFVFLCGVASGVLLSLVVISAMARLVDE